MDIATLLKTILTGLKESKARFYKSSTKDEKRRQYDMFMKDIDKLNKVYKAHTTTETASNRIKEILISGIKDANSMKKEMENFKSEARPHKSNAPNLDRGKSENKGDDDNSDDELSGAIGGAIVSDKPNVKWEDVAGLENAKRALKEAIVLPTKFPDIFVGIRKPWKGILLYGVG